MPWHDRSAQLLLPAVPQVRFLKLVLMQPYVRPSCVASNEKVIDQRGDQPGQRPCLSRMTHLRSDSSLTVLTTIMLAILHHNMLTNVLFSPSIEDEEPKAQQLPALLTHNLGHLRHANLGTPSYH